MKKPTQKSTPKATIILDARRSKLTDLYPVKLRVTYERRQVYYSTPYDLTKKEFEATMRGERLTDAKKELKRKIQAFEDKATAVIKNLSLFTWDSFEKQYTTNRAAKDSINAAFDIRIKELRQLGQISTAVNYECAKNSLNAFAPNVKFVEITPSLLTEYEISMLKNGKSKTTISMYLRCLRTLFNTAINNEDILPSMYPFRRNETETTKYEIPTGSNTKKALSMADIEKIFNYSAVQGSTREMAKDYWVFIYLTSGLNVKDLCLLKYKNIEGDSLTFIRAKTVRQKKEKTIQAVIQPETMAILEKWGNKKVDGNTFLFPVLTGEETPERQRQLVQQLTRVINDHMKTIAKELGITKSVATYAARHSFATVMKRSGASTELISEMLGHSSLTVTQNYLDSFENETLKQATNALTAFKKQTIKSE